MIITIKGANYATANLGTVSEVSIRKVINYGLTHNIPNYTTKGTSVNWVISAGTDYAFSTYSISMNGETINPTITESTMTISISNVTGPISVVVNAVFIGEGREPAKVDPAVAYDFSQSRWKKNYHNMTNGTLGGTANDGQYTAMVTYVPCTPNTTYIIMYNYEEKGVRFCQFFDQNYVSIGGLGDDGKLSTSITTPENCYYIRFTLSTNYGKWYELNTQIVDENGRLTYPDASKISMAIK